MSEKYKALLFVWRHGVLGVVGHDSIDAAVNAAEAISDYGNGAPHGVLADGRWVTSEDEPWKAIRRERDARERSVEDAEPLTTHVLDVQAPDGKWAQEYGYPSFDAARAAADCMPTPCRIRTAGLRSQTVWKSAGSSQP